MNKAILPKKQIKISTTSSWVDNFAGKWKDSRSTSQIINDIHAARTPNSENFFSRIGNTMSNMAFSLPYWDNPAHKILPSPPLS